MRYDLAFFLCCCKSFLGSSASENGHEDFYVVLGIDRDASPEEIKRAYKRQSLQMHPDKLAQRGQQVTEADQAKFQRMKEAYEVLSDPHKRETYDAIGERGMKWIEEPFSLDPQEMARNFANSSTIDRSKIFSIFICIAIAVLILPILICLQVDRILGDARWTAILTPLWIWNSIILLYYIRIITLGPTSRPDNIPEADWEDPFPMLKRFVSLVRFLLIVAFEILASLNLDGYVELPWSQIFIPIYLWEITTLYKKLPLARMRIVTVEDLENALGKPYEDFTQAEKDLIVCRYSVVPSLESPEFEAAHRLKSRARQEIIKVCFRAIFLAVLIAQLDLSLDWNWWLIFTPFWLMSFCICCGSYQSFAETQGALAEIDPSLFNDDENQNLNGSAYGAMGGKSNVSAEKKEELKAQLLQQGYKLVTSCCSQAFMLIMVSLFVGKLQGAGYSSFWIISPVLIIASLILLCLGCTIFCITDVPSEEELDSTTKDGVTNDVVGITYFPPPEPPKSTWDPEKGEIWVDNNNADDVDPSSANATSPEIPTPTITGVISQPNGENDTNVAVDLLDNYTAPPDLAPNNEESNNQTSAIDELD